MFRPIPSVAGVAALAFLVGGWAAGRPPATAPAMPPGHPPIAAEPPARPAAAIPPGVDTVGGIVAAYYDTISGPAGQERDWDRFRSLFMTDARLVTVRTAGARARVITLTPEDFIRGNRTYFEKGGYFEREIHHQVDRFGFVAHVFSTYESRRRLDEERPYSRGINSMQLINDGERWWIATIMWDYERPEENPIPPVYLQ